MLFFILSFVICFVLPFAFIQWLLVERYCRYMSRIPARNDLKTWAKSAPLPAVEILLPIRGIEPSLERNLRAILEQDYDHFRLHVILDSSEDSAFRQVQQLIDEGKPVVIHLLDLSTQNAGLKPLGLSQVCVKLLQSGSTETAFVFTDADTMHAQDWLLRLVWGLKSFSPEGAVTGNRWYWQRAGEATAGSRVRSLWNVASLPQMHQYGVAWGGSWAIGGTALKKSGLLEAWQVSLFEDTMVKAHIAPERLVTVPGLYSVSDDSLDLQGARRWVHRQLLDLRLYHKAFPLVAAHAGLTFLASALTLVVVGICCVYPSFDSGLGVLLVALFHLSNVAIWWRLNRTGNRCLTTLGLTPASSGIKVGSEGLLGSLQALTLTQVLYPRSMLQVIFTREVSWRGIEYRLAKGRVERLNYSVRDH